MGKTIRGILVDWPKSFISTAEILMTLGKSENACYLAIERAVKAGLLVRLRRGLYLIAGKKGLFVDEFELALQLYGPSFVSLESALSYRGLIPEAVYVVTCVTTNRAREFKTPIGTFMYKRVPMLQFYLGVERLETKSGVVFIASCWRALADLIYTRRKNWATLRAVSDDLRIDYETLLHEDETVLCLLQEQYPSSRVRVVLRRLLKDKTKELKEVV